MPPAQGPAEGPSSNVLLDRCQPESAAVPLRVYGAVEPGDVVRVRVKPGALGMPWFTVVPRG
jgi:hypothetical protein